MSSGESVTLKTGIQGAGKTLSAVAELAAMLAKWEKNPLEARPVFVHGVRDLKLDHTVLPIYPADGSPGDPVEVDDVGQPVDACFVDWSAVPHGAHVIIDEAQKLFPPRGPSSKVPKHVGWFALSRQYGCTVVLCTQAPTSIDMEVRKRCGLHQHYTKLFWGLVSVREWVGKDWTRPGKATSWRVWKRPQAAFGWYRSAEIHTAGAGARVPFWMLIPMAALALGLWAVPAAYRAVSSSMSGKGVSSAAAASSPASRPVPALGDVFQAVGPPAASAPPDAPVVPARPVYLGCIVLGPRCACVGADGVTADLPRSECVTGARTFAGVMPYPVKHDVPTASPYAALQPAASAPGTASEAVARAMGQVGVQAASAAGLGR